MDRVWSVICRLTETTKSGSNCSAQKKTWPDVKLSARCTGPDCRSWYLRTAPAQPGRPTVRGTVVGPVQDQRFTYFSTWRDSAYVAFVMDKFARQNVRFRVSSSLQPRSTMVQASLPSALLSVHRDAFFFTGSPLRVCKGVAVAT
jgi:hypothetical protein